MTALSNEITILVCFFVKDLSSIMTESCQRIQVLWAVCEDKGAILNMKDGLLLSPHSNEFQLLIKYFHEHNRFAVPEEITFFGHSLTA